MSYEEEIKGEKSQLKIWFGELSEDPKTRLIGFGEVVGGNNEIFPYKELNRTNNNNNNSSLVLNNKNKNNLLDNYDIGKLEIANLNIDDSLFKEYVDEEFKNPFLIEFKKIGGKKYYNRKTKKIAKQHKLSKKRSKIINKTKIRKQIKQYSRRKTISG
jgi:hypothetical protein